MANKVWKIRKHRDEIHGDVTLDPMAEALLNTAPLQRLGRVYQLGYAHLVYRGATHTRLSHVMGAYHVAGRLVDCLRENYRLWGGTLPAGGAEQEDFLPRGSKAEANDESRWLVLRYLVQWAALLHDVGHIPLGHTLEDEFEGIYTGHDKLESPRLRQLWHRTAAGGLPEIQLAFTQNEDLFPPEFVHLGISPETAFAAVLTICLHRDKTDEEQSPPTHKNFSEVLREAEEIEKARPDVKSFVQFVRSQVTRADGVFHPFMADIVADTICADFIDYIRRDTANAGLDRQTDDRVLSQFLVGRYIPPSSPVEFRMALLLTDGNGQARLDACTGVVELVRKRFRLAEIIYYHKTKVSASAMLAKALALLGDVPEAASAEPELIRLDEVKETAARIIGGGSALESLQQHSLPSSMLSVDIGDESLLLWLQYHAWRLIQDTVAHKPPRRTTTKKLESEPERSRETSPQNRVEAALRALTQLQMLARRRLYKAFAQIKAPSVAAICDIPADFSVLIDNQVSRALELRKSNQRRSELESAMAKAADWPDDSLLIYIPPLKGQAKGIETRALFEGHLLTLGRHPVVRQDVAVLNAQYRALWRVILLVHPDYQHEPIGLSRALDLFVRETWEREGPDVEVPLMRVSRFDYIPEPCRAAAAEFSRLMAKDRPDWGLFLRALRTVEGATISTEEHIYRACLLQMAAVKTSADERKSSRKRRDLHYDWLKKAYPKSNDLPRSIQRRMAATVAAEPREGASQLSKDDLLRTTLKQEMEDILRSQNS